jgi:hypothetical protein
LRVPNAEAARVDLEKVTGYLLSETHPIGKVKAKFFKGLGFVPELPGELVWALLDVARSHEVVDQVVTSFGTKYVVDGVVRGRTDSAQVRTVWLVETGGLEPRLVTAYPVPKGSGS